MSFYDRDPTVPFWRSNVDVDLLLAAHAHRPDRAQAWLKFRDVSECSILEQAVMMRGHFELGLLTARGQGLLLNEKFVGRVVWNKRRSVKDPKTGRRVTRTNPESEWIVQSVPELRILEDKLFEAARARRLDAATPASRRRPKSTRLLSGLLTWGMCMSSVSSHPFVRLRPPLRPDRGLFRMTRADQGRPFRAAAQRPGLGFRASHHA
jgi:Recombinase